LKETFTSAPVLAHVDPEKPFSIEANASEFALARQRDDGELYPITLHSRKFIVEISYKVHDKELLAMIDFFA
jgi:hypothetical protein